MSPTRHIPVAEAGHAVRDVMLYDPRTVTPDTSVDQVRETFANPSVKLLLVADDDTYLGSLAPEDLPDDASGTIAAYVRTDTPRLHPGDPTASALRLLEETGLKRIPVVEGDRLEGLVCLNSGRSAFCASP